MGEQQDCEARRRWSGFESVPLRVTVLVGRARLTLGRISGLESGELIELDRRIGEPFDLLARDTPLGHFEPVAAEEGVALKLVSASRADEDADG